MLSYVSFRSSPVWRNAQKLSRSVRIASGLFPVTEDFRMVHTMKGYGVSVASHIARGLMGNSSADRVRFFTAAHDSLCELTVLVRFFYDIGFLKEGAYSDLMHDIRSLGVDIAGLQSEVVDSDRERAYSFAS